MIPPFDERGLLPASPNDLPYSCTAEELRARVVIEPGNQSWRRELFDQWDILRQGVAVLVPGARWWLWGRLITRHPKPLFGEREIVDAAVLMPAGQFPTAPHEVAMVMGFLHSALEQHRVDVRYAFVFDDDDPRARHTAAVLGSYRAQACRNIADYETMDLVPAGYVEVTP